jgi:hypothetical protein
MVLAGDGQLDHPQAVVPRRDGVGRLVGRRPGGHKQDLVQPLLVERLFGSHQVAVVDGIKSATQDPQPLGRA